MERRKGTDIDGDLNRVLKTVTQVEGILICTLVVEQAVFQFLVVLPHQFFVLFFGARRVLICQIKNLLSNLLWISLFKSLSHVEVVIRRDHTITVLVQ